MTSQNELVQSVGSFRRLQTGSNKHAGYTLASRANDTAADCIRGIEFLCCPASIRRQILRRYALINAVLQCQSSQQSDDVTACATCTKAKILCDISIAQSQADADRALMLAAQDEAAAKLGAGTRRVQRFAQAS